MAGYSTPAWTNNSSPAIDATALSNIGQGIELSEHPYGVCSTTGSTAAKTVTIDFSGTLALFAGLTVRVKFTHANTANNPTLNVNSTGAASIMVYGTTNASGKYWNDGETVQFTYDGTNWLMDNSNGKSVLYFTGQTVSSAEVEQQICRVPASGTNPAITADHIVINPVFRQPGYIISDVTWTTYDGYVTFTGRTSASTSVSFALIKKVN